MTNLPVNEMFDTIQGEATWTGSPATFVRLQGCGVGCPWCDTKHTWPLRENDEVNAATMLAKTADAPTYASVDEDELATVLVGRLPDMVVITGGEPCIYDLVRLTAMLVPFKQRVQIETSGTQTIRVADQAWVTLSPKIGMPGGYPLLPDAVARADEVKWPCGSPRDVEALQAFLVQHRPPASVPIWLQPLSRSPKATAMCIEAATTHGWRVSIQTHAFLAIR